MRLPYSLTAVVSVLAAHQVPIVASAGGDIALTGVTSLVFFNLVGADQIVSDQSRFLRGNKVDEGDMEERGINFKEAIEKVKAKNLVEKVVRTESFSALEKVDDPAQIKKITEAVDKHMNDVFKFVDSLNMKPRDLVNQLKNMPEADDAISAKAVELYTDYLKKLGQ